MIMSLFWICGLILLVLAIMNFITQPTVVQRCPYQNEHRDMLEKWAIDEYPNTPPSWFKKMAKGDLIGLWYMKPDPDILPQKIYNKE